MKSKTTYLTAIWLFIASLANSQYCEPLHGNQLLSPVILGVSVGTINNQNTSTPLTTAHYSDYTAMQTMLAAGSTYSITVTSGSVWPHNYAAWIDFDHNQQFESNEELGFHYNMGAISSTWTFTVPSDALSGPTRLRVRGMNEPFGPWLYSRDPCVPAEDGEAEDYTVIITGGGSIDMELTKIISPVNGTGLGNEVITVRMSNRGNTPASNILLDLKIDNMLVATEVVTGPIAPGGYLDHSFSSVIDLSNLVCKNIQITSALTGDAISANNGITQDVCNLQPLAGSDVWYVHSNQFFPMEPLGQGSTNETTMNTVFGPGNWQLGHFETLLFSQVFSTSSCAVFIDGSYGDIDPLKVFLDSHIEEIEDWVAAGGNLFLNSSPTSNNFNDTTYVMDWGFDGVKLVQGFDIGYAIPAGAHPIHTGPYMPIGTEWSAFNFSEGVLYGPELTPIIIDNDDDHFLTPELNLPMLAEKSWGDGTVIFGTVGASQEFFNPGESMNSRFNILNYIHNCNISTSIEDAIEPGMKVFPNPCSNQLMIETTGSGISHVSVYASQGKEVVSIAGQHTLRRQLDLSELVNGSYFLRVILDNGNVLTKIVVKAD